MRRLITCLLLAMAMNASAAEDTELQRLNLLLGALNHEQQALIQQIQIIQEMRRSNTQAMCNGQFMPPGMMDYADWVTAQQAVAQREYDFRSQTDELYARWKELEADKRPVLRRIHALALPSSQE